MLQKLLQYYGTDRQPYQANMYMYLLFH